MKLMYSVITNCPTDIHLAINLEGLIKISNTLGEKATKAFIRAPQPLIGAFKETYETQSADRYERFRCFIKI